MTSAFKILKSFDDFSYINLLGDEKYMLSLIKTNKDEGREEGRKEGREEGIKEGIKKGKSEGLKEGRENFQIETLIKLFYKGNDNLDNFLDLIIGDETEIKYQKIKSKFKGDEKRSQQFVKWLGRKKRLASFNPLCS